MYVPEHYKAPSVEAIESVIRTYNFGILITPGLLATHLPFELEKNNGGPDTLFGHLAFANPQSKIENGTDVLVVFTGPHCYISSSWYEKSNVPTWNYLSVHVYGKIRLLNAEETYRAMNRQLSQYEDPGNKSSSLEKLPGNFVSAHLKAIVAFRIEVEKMECAFKLSQNRNDEDYKEIISQLENRNDDNSNAIAREMRKIRGL